MLKDILLVGIGSCFGGICRYLVSVAMRGAAAFPWGTLTANMAGCLLIGVLWGMQSRFPHVAPWCTPLLAVGFCGGFTTFSTFSRESLSLLQAGDYLPFAFYAVGSVLLGILAVALGFLLAK